MIVQSIIIFSLWAFETRNPLCNCLQFSVHETGGGFYLAFVIEAPTHPLSIFSVILCGDLPVTEWTLHPIHSHLTFHLPSGIFSTAPAASSCRIWRDTVDRFFPVRAHISDCDNGPSCIRSNSPACAGCRFSVEAVISYDLAVT